MEIRNIAIIAHVDHGKTTLVDAILKQTAVFSGREEVAERVMDSMDLEREKGITIKAKNASVQYKGVKINIIDTPGHADFGGEVERVLRMADSALLLIDAHEGPKPQTTFVLKKALSLGLHIIVVINKMDRTEADHASALNKTFDLFVQLNASDSQLDFPVVYASGVQGIAYLDPAFPGTNLDPLFEVILKHTPPPAGDEKLPLQMLVLNLAYDHYVGRLAIGKINNGAIAAGGMASLIKKDGSIVSARVRSVRAFQGLDRKEVPQAYAGDIVAIAGFDNAEIGETIADAQNPVAMPILEVDEPTVEITVLPNDGPLSGREGSMTTSRQIKERFARELETNVSLRVRDEGQKGLRVSARGELQLAVCFEQMRREGFELAVSRPEVIYKTVNGTRMEPFETLTIETPQEHSGAIIAEIGKRKGIMEQMVSLDRGTQYLEFIIPTRGVMGLKNALQILTRGTATTHHAFRQYDAQVVDLAIDPHGSMISMERGKAVAYALWNLEERGTLFVRPGDEVYEGMVIGQASREYDMEVNPIKHKKLTNMRSKASDDAIDLSPARAFTMESALEYLGPDELLEITPRSLRVRKKILDPHERKKISRV